MDNSVSSYANLIKDSIDAFVLSYDRAEDPISLLLGPEGSWLLSNPSIDIDKETKKEFIVKIVSDLNKVIIKNSKEKFQMYNANITRDSIVISIGNLNDSDMIVWSLFDNNVKIPLFDDAISLELENKFYNKKLREVELEYDDTKIILSNSDNLLNNGLYTIYLKSKLRRFKYKKDVSDLLNSLETDIMMYNTSINDCNSKIKTISENEDLLELINLLNISFQKFPYINTFNDYKVLKKDDK